VVLGVFMQDGWEDVKHKKKKGKKSELERMTGKARSAAKFLRQFDNGEVGEFTQRWINFLKSDLIKAKRYLESIKAPVDKKELKLYNELKEITRDVKLKKGGK
jgi:hypothetical protein